MAEISGVRRRFVRAAMDAPFLEREEEHALAVRWKDDRDEVALHRLASAHMRLVIALAARFRHYGLPMADLIQEGHVGLLEAAARFEPERDVRFSTYATWWIPASPPRTPPLMPRSETTTRAPPPSAWISSSTRRRSRTRASARRSTASAVCAGCARPSKS